MRQSCAYTFHLVVADMQAPDVQSLGSPGINALRWLKPVYPGDAFALQVETLEVKRSSSRPEMGSARSHWVFRNRDGLAVMSMEGVAVRHAAAGRLRGAALITTVIARWSAIAKTPMASCAIAMALIQ